LINNNSTPSKNILGTVRVASVSLSNLYRFASDFHKNARKRLHLSFVDTQKAKSGNAELGVAAAMFVFVFPAIEIVVTNFRHILHSLTVLSYAMLQNSVSKFHRIYRLYIKYTMIHAIGK
jgi:hypothetical protein